MVKSCLNSIFIEYSKLAYFLLYFINYGHIRIQTAKQVVFLPRLRTRAWAVKPKVWSEKVKTESKTGPKDVWGSCASRESLTPALRVFAKQIMKKKKKKKKNPTVFQSTYVVVLQKVEKKTWFTQKPCITTKALMTINSECLYWLKMRRKDWLNSVFNV